MRRTEVRLGLFILSALLVGLMVLINVPVLGILGFIGLGLWIASGIGFGKDRKASIVASEHLSLVSRRLLRPVRRLAAFNRELARKHKKSLETNNDALRETEYVLKQSIRWLEVRDRLSEELQGKVDAERRHQDLMRRQATSVSPLERSQLDAALQASEGELAHYAKLEQQIEAIHGRIVYSTFAMESLKTILSLASINPGQESQTKQVSGSGIALRG